MSAIDGLLDTVLSVEPTPVTEVVSEVRELIDSTIQDRPDLIPTFFENGLCCYDAEERVWYGRANIAVRERLYELALRGIVVLTKNDVRLAE